MSTHKRQKSPRQFGRSVRAVVAVAVAVTLALPAATATASASLGTVLAASAKSAYPSDSLPYRDYMLDVLSGFATVKQNHPDTLADNGLKTKSINHSATAEQIKRAQSDARTSAETTVADGLGGQLGGLFLKALTDGDLPLTKSALSLVEQGIGSPDPAKAFYANQRPFEVFGFGNAAIIQRDDMGSYDGLRGQGSYPSGHTEHAYTAATVLATLLPELAPQLLARASEAGNNRVILGVHYPLDVIGGRMLGQSVVGLRWSDPSFRSLLEGAGTELRAVLAKRCGQPLYDCISSDSPYLPTAEALNVYEERMSYGFAPVAATDAAASVPAGAENLLLVAFPSFSAAQRRQILAATETSSGSPLDKIDSHGSWQRLNLAAALSATVSVDAGGALVVNGVPMSEQAHPNVDTLQQDGDMQQRWLSTPGSRAVINPLDYKQGKTEVETSGGPQLPLGVAYYASDTNNVAKDVLGLYEATADSSPTIYHDTFDSLDPAWKATDVTPVIADSSVAVTLPPSAPKGWGNLTRSVVVDLARTPTVKISVPSTTGKWSLKVNDGTQSTDIGLTPTDMSTPGTFTYDIAAITGWSGIKTLQLRLFIVGKGTTTTVGDLGFTLKDVADGRSFADTFTQLDPAWHARRNATAEIQNGTLVLAMPAGTSTTWGGATRKITVDLDANPFIRVQSAGGDGLWSLKANDGGADIELQHDTDAIGDNIYDLSSQTGWTGTKSFTLILNVIGGGKQVAFDSVSLEPRNSKLAPATNASTQWRADSLPFQADYGSGAHITGMDLFHDENSLTRVVSTGGFTSSSSVATLSGRIVGAAGFDASRGILTVMPNAKWSYAIDLHSLGEIQFYPNLQSMLGGSSSSTTPLVGGYWTADLPDGSTSAIGIGFGTAAEGPEVAATRSTGASDPKTAAADVRRSYAYWNDLLARVPVAQTFDIAGAPAQGVIGSQVESAYYLAWILNQENVLPVMSETGYDYPQVATGKASGWMKGPDGAHPSATWDSLLGMQYLAYIDPKTAVDAFKGMMTLTDNKGQLGGESLPSLKAKTAWTIAEITGDETVIADTYNDLKRYLDWAAKNPRWIDGGYDHANEHDSEFVISLLIDYEYAEKIAKALGHTSDVSYWKEAQQVLAANYDSWFLQPNGSVLQYFYTGDPSKSSSGTNIVITGGLHANVLSETAMAASLKRFDATFDPSKTLAGLNGVADSAVKAPNAMFTAYGLLDNNRAKDADGWVEAVLRDVVKTGQFAETYKDLPGVGLKAGGVRPSVFGAATVIDSVWMMNGVRSDLGTPTAVNLTGNTGGVNGLTWHGRKYSISTDDTATATFSGPAVADASCTSVMLQRGETYMIGETPDAECSSLEPGGGGENPGGGGENPGGGGENPGGGGENPGGGGENPGGGAYLGRGIEIVVNPVAGTLSVRLDHAYAAASVAFTTHSKLTSLGEHKLDADAMVVLDAPNQLEAGQHMLIATINGVEIARGKFVWPGARGLASTGLSIPQAVTTSAGLALFAGATLILLRRKRRTQVLANDS